METISPWNMWDVLVIGEVEPAISVAAHLPRFNVSIDMRTTTHEMGRISTKCTALLGCTPHTYILALV